GQLSRTHRNVFHATPAGPSPLQPGLTIPSFAPAAVWMPAAMAVAARQALDYTSTAPAIAIGGVGWTLARALAFLLASSSGRTLPGTRHLAGCSEAIGARSRGVETGRIGR